MTTTKLHIMFGLINIVLAALAGAAGHGSPPQVDAGPGRTYCIGDVHWDVDGLSSSESGDRYLCSDGRRLYAIRYSYDSPEAATTVLEGRLKGTSPVANADDDVLRVARNGGLFLVTRRRPLTLDAASAEDELTTEGIWQCGSILYVICGPSPTHVRELYEANPDQRWGAYSSDLAPN